MQENTDQNNSEYVHFLRSDLRSIYILCPGALVHMFEKSVSVLMFRLMKICNLNHEIPQTWISEQSSGKKLYRISAVSLF